MLDVRKAIGIIAVGLVLSIAQRIIKMIMYKKKK